MSRGFWLEIMINTGVAFQKADLQSFVLMSGTQFPPAIPYCFRSFNALAESVIAGNKGSVQNFYSLAVNEMDENVGQKA
jgi:hypothetical protein